MVLVTERLKVGQIGPHIIYKIAKTATIPITAPAKQDKLTAKTLRNDEARYYQIHPKNRIEMFKKKSYLCLRYRNLFSFIDLTKEFYFSYTLDISRTLQENMCNHHSPGPNFFLFFAEFTLF